MDAEFSRKLLTILVENSVRILSAGFGVDRAEATFFDVIDLLRNEKALRSDFFEMAEKTLGKRDASGLDSGDVPRELMELVAHEMRWPELQALAEKRVGDYFHGDRTLAIGDIATSIASAYKDDWLDREFYKHYGRASKAVRRNE
jgi:hypothetical protein